MSDIDRDIAKFYDKIRQSVQHLGSPSKSASRSRTSNTGDSSRAKNENIFGEVTKEQMESILQSYERQQNDADMSNKPVACDENVIKGGSYAKMLYANSGFHHLGSTNYLIKRLEINDHTRSSFLGDYNTFSVPDSEDLDGLKRKYVIAEIKKTIDLSNQQMNSNDMPRARQLIEHALKLDPKSGIAKLAMGKYLDVHREYEEAAKVFREALNCEDVNKEQVNLNLSNALYQQGLFLYHRNQWHDAAIIFSQSIEADPQNVGARMHLDLSNDRIRKLRTFRPQERSYRK